MASKTSNNIKVAKSSASTSSSTKSKIITPLNPGDVNFDNVTYSELIRTDFGKWINVNYQNNDTTNSLRLVMKACTILSFKEKLPFGSKDGKVEVKEGKKKKFDMWLGIKDTNVIEFFKSLDNSVCQKAVECSNSWFDTEMSEEDCKTILKPTLTHNDKYGYSITIELSPDFVCKSKTNDVTDVSDLNIALAKFNVVDLCVNIKTVKLGVGKFSLGLEICQSNITSIASKSEFKNNGITPEEYVPNKLSLSKIIQHPKGGKYLEVYNDGEGKKLRIQLKDLALRCFKLDIEGKVSYSFGCRLKDENTRKMFETIQSELFEMLLADSKTFYDKKYTKNLFKTIFSEFVSYSKADQEKIKKGIKMQYPPSIYFKIPYYSEEKGFEGKVVDSEDNKPITNIESILNKELDVSSLEIYCKHIWFGPKGTSTSFVVNKCKINRDVPPEYNMDDVEDDDNNNDNDEEEVNNSDEEQPNNSDEEEKTNESEEAIESEEEEVVEVVVKPTPKSKGKK